MTVKITYLDPDIQHWCDIEIPEGLLDVDALRQYIWQLNLSRAGKRAAFRAAKRKYQSYHYDPELWDEEEYK